MVVVATSSGCLDVAAARNGHLGVGVSTYVDGGSIVVVCAETAVGAERTVAPSVRIVLCRIAFGNKCRTVVNGIRPLGIIGSGPDIATVVSGRCNRILEVGRCAVSCIVALFKNYVGVAGVILATVCIVCAMTEMGRRRILVESVVAPDDGVVDSELVIFVRRHVVDTGAVVARNGIVDNGSGFRHTHTSVDVAVDEVVDDVCPALYPESATEVVVGSSCACHVVEEGVVAYVGT